MGDFINVPPSRIHGDLWSGNLMFSNSNMQVEAVLIDPAARSGHPEEDLAMLELFGGTPFFSHFLNSYTEHSNLPYPNSKIDEGFSTRTTIYNLFPIAAHVVFFGGGYLSQFNSMVKSLLNI